MNITVLEVESLQQQKIAQSATTSGIQLTAGAPCLDKADARIAALEGRVRTLETLVHRLLNPAVDEPDCDRCGGY